MGFVGRALSVGAALVAVVATAGTAHATPGKSPQWTLQLVGTCNGVPAVVIDPPGPGPTGFSLNDGRMGVGRLFEGVNTATGEIAFADEYGVALEHANQPITTCEFPIPPALSPDGTANWVFRVTGFFR
ncbi:hypothetical protein ACWEOW_10380 [Monashia sp. NPDC004114]